MSPGDRLEMPISLQGEDLLLAVGRAVEAQDIATATRLAHDALAHGFENSLLLCLRANEHREAGRLTESLTDLRRANFLDPREVTILDSTGLTLLEMDKGEDALRCYDLALAIDPLFDVGWVNRGWTLQWLGRGAAASESYERALQINPLNAHALARLAALVGKRGDRTRAAALAEQAHGLLPEKPDAELILAEIGLSDPATTELQLRTMLESELNPKQRAHALSLLADALDALDRPAEAFAAYVEANELFRESNAERFGTADGPSMTKALDMLRSWVEALDPSEWVDDRGDGKGEAGEIGHVFLTGFSRSGTTLIESVLGVHPDVVHLEERDTLRGAAVAFLDRQRDLANLTRASRRTLQGLRDDYWSRVREFGVDPTGKVFIDKGPFNTSRLALIRRLFPKAKILFALRDPRDVVLSSFRRRFRMNVTTYSLLRLEDAASFYAATMDFADKLRAKIVIDEHMLIYERLIADFETEARAVCNFIGLDWRDDLIDFADRAKRGGVNSASSEQISRGLYTDGTSHWRRYRDQIAPILPILQPWVDRFGYRAE
jgi:tetratricopeptide (TPR) repeat protein